MLNGTKEAHDIYIKTMLTNVANDEKCYLMKKRSPFVDNIHACGAAYKGMEDCEEALVAMRDTLKTAWEYSKKNIPQAEMIKQYRTLSTRAYLLMLDAMQVSAMALTAAEQLKDYEEDVANE